MWTFLKDLSSKREVSRLARRVDLALSLNRRGEVRMDGLKLRSLRTKMEIEWIARGVHPWDRDVTRERAQRLFTDQCLDDAEAAVYRLFERNPTVDIVDVRVFQRGREEAILSVSVTRRAAMAATALPTAAKRESLGLNRSLMHFDLR